MMNKADPAEPSMEGRLPVWVSVALILILGAVVASSILYAQTGSLFGLDGWTARALVVLALLVMLGLWRWGVHRSRR